QRSQPDLTPMLDSRSLASRSLVPWCNGSTTDSGSVSLGSNPRGTIRSSSFTCLGRCILPAMNDDLARAAEVIRQANALLIGAGAGMGVDSGLPCFRGNEGFWKAYPPFRKLGLSFVDLAQPHWFHAKAHQAWGFYGHRRNLYRRTAPHA